MDNEVAHTGEASSIDSPGQTSLSLSSGSAPSSSSGTAPAAGRPAPEVGDVVVATATQPMPRSIIRETETEDQSNAKRQRELASRPDRHGADVNADICRTIVLAADPEDRDEWTQQVVDWNKKCLGAKSGHLGHLFESQTMSEDRIK